jgi:GDP-mannose 4,6-dehydratase
MGALIRHLEAIKPDVIFHLAAQSYVLTSFNSSIQTLWSNVIGTANLLEAVRINRIDPVIHVCSSSEVYGQVSEADVPIRETCPLKPASPYAVSKVGEDMLGLQYWLSYQIKTIRTRMFTHTGPRRGDVFALSFFAKQIAAGEQGLKEAVIHVGNLKSVRTFCDVRDAVRAYWILVNQCKPGEVYNIGGNRTMTIGDALDLLLSFSSMNFEIRVDPKLLRPSDVTLQIPCTDKFSDETGWKPEIPLEKTLEDMLNYWRDELSRNPWKALTVVK